MRCRVPLPVASAKDQVRAFIEFSGEFQGPPASFQPSQLCAPISMPFFAAISAA